MINRETGSCRIKPVFWVGQACDCWCSVALPHGVVGWSAVCDCGISCSYSLTFGGLLSFSNVPQRLARIFKNFACGNFSYSAFQRANYKTWSDCLGEQVSLRPCS